MTIFHIGVEHFQQFSEWMSADFYGVISNSENLVIWWKKKIDKIQLKCICVYKQADHTITCTVYRGLWNSLKL